MIGALWSGAEVTSVLGCLFLLPSSVSGLIAGCANGGEGSFPAS